MMSKMDTLNETELRGLASMHLMRMLSDDCKTHEGRLRVRAACFHIKPYLYWTLYYSVRNRVRDKTATLGCARAIVAHWLKASDR